ncbi:hypothetical protein A2U01_0018987 [Trifolium medium]|uniref:Lipoprotein n=1 Tax=Trifolium medium TaxID=97028 RepID=A0A392NFX5_9FABA|nr:hypothetical protein [Trifolium medium]
MNGKMSKFGGFGYLLATGSGACAPTAAACTRAILAFDLDQTAQHASPLIRIRLSD